MLVLDLSSSMNDKDYLPSRIDLTLQLVQKFVLEYFDQNPISQFGVISTRNGRAEFVSPISGDMNSHITALQNKRLRESCSGGPSLQNALELAFATLG